MRYGTTDIFLQKLDANSMQKAFAVEESLKVPDGDDVALKQLGRANIICAWTA